jgi:hypothetical protein
MRLDMTRVMAVQISVGDTLCFPNPELDYKVTSIYAEAGFIIFNNRDKVEPDAYVFRKVA